MIVKAPNIVHLHDNIVLLYFDFFHIPVIAFHGIHLIYLPNYMCIHPRVCPLKFKVFMLFPRGWLH